MNGLVAQLEQLFGHRGNVVGCHAEFAHDGVAWSREAKTIDGDVLTLKANVFAPSVGDTRFHRDTSCAAGW